MRPFFSILFPLLLLLTGCAHESAPPAPAHEVKPLPAWYLHPPQNDARWLYGVGEGETMEEATKQALADLLARLSVTVSSTWRSRQYSHEDVYEYVEKERSHEIETRVRALPLPHYRTLESAHPAWNRYLALVGVERKDLSKSLASEIARERERLERRWREAKERDGMTRLRAAEAAAKGYEALLPKALTLASVDPSAGELARKVEEKYLEYARQAGEEKARLRFCIDTPASDPFAKAAAAALSAKGYTVSDKKACPKEAIRVKLDKTLTHERSYGFYIVKGTVDLKLYDKEGKAIKSRRYPVKGVSSQSRRAATLKAAESFGKVMEAESF